MLAEINLTQETAYKHNLQRMLRSIRMACGFTQDDIAATLCINRTTYTSYETGKACPDFITLVKLGTVFQIPPETFLHPEKYANLETPQQQVRHMPAMDPQKVGDLSEEEKKIIAAHRQKTNFPTKAPDKISSSIEDALGQFNIKKNYKGYPFSVNAIREALNALPESLTTSGICELVSANEGADPAVVGRELKRMVSNIWGVTENPPVYSRIVGHEIATRPLPVEFIYALAGVNPPRRCQWC
jgi:DNA-binding XRE family transcriptional regulator